MEARNTLPLGRVLMPTNGVQCSACLRSLIACLFSTFCSYCAKHVEKACISTTLRIFSGPLAVVFDAYFFHLVTWSVMALGKDTFRGPGAPVTARGLFSNNRLRCHWGMFYRLPSGPECCVLNCLTAISDNLVQTCLSFGVHTTSIDVHTTLM